MTTSASTLTSSPSMSTSFPEPLNLSTPFSNKSLNCAGEEPVITHNVSGIQLPFPVLFFFAVPATVIILLTIFGNLLVLCFKARVGRTNTTLLVWNLGLTDFLVGVLVLPMGAVHLISRKWLFGRLLCRIWVAADVTFCTCSVVTICVISADRYLAVTRPLRYKSLVTKVKVIMVMIVIWTFSSAILLTTVKWEHSSSCLDDTICFAGNEIRYLAHSVVFAFFLPASVTLTLYWRIYKLARNRQKALDRGFLMILGHNMNFLTNTLSQNTTLRVHFGQNNGMVEHQRRVLRTHERIAKTLGVVSCSFLFCWLPFFSLYLTNYQCRGCIPTIAIDVASWLGYCNSMLNPIIYSFTVKEFKRSALRVLLPFWRLIYHCVPRCIPKPPDYISRVSRNGNRAKGRRSNEAQKNHRPPPALMPTKIQTNKRRCTEPAIFALTRTPTSATNRKLKPLIEEPFEMRHTIAEDPYHSDDAHESSENTEPLMSFENNASISINTTNTNTNTNLNELNNRSPIGSVYYQAKISPTNSGSSAAQQSTRSKNTIATTVSSSAWNWFGGGKLRRRAGVPDSEEQRQFSRDINEEINKLNGKLAGSLSGSWHNIKNVAQERAKRWALGVHSSSVDGGGPVGRQNGDIKDVRKPLLSQTNSASATKASANRGEHETGRAEMEASSEQLNASQEGSIRVYWHTPETHL